MKKILFSIFALAAVSPLGAKVINPDAALARAINSTRSVSGSEDFKLHSTINTESGSAAVYLFSNDNSSLILSADDGTPIVLGILDSPIPENSENAGFKYWMKKYASQIEWLRNNPQQPQTRAEVETAKEAIGPLLTTKWDQGSPYNDQSPDVDGTRSYSGCVATAMSQVMNYHEWPEKGTGSHSYKATTANKTMSCDFSKITFDWKNMLDTYSGSSTQAQKKAVADLLYACAVSVEMDFSPNGSGAWSENVPGALVNYFNYDKALKIEYRDFYTQTEWNDKVYDELTKYGPVYYAGSSDDGAHAFVCDGYKDGYYHINWGWSGSLDGYYLLSALFPGTQQGAGGSTGAYNFDQLLLHGVQRPLEGSKMAPVVLCPWGYKFDQKTIPLNVALTVNGWVMNYSTNPINGLLGLIIETSDGKQLIVEGITEKIGNESNATYSCKPVEGNWNYKCKLPEDIAEGEYVVYPAIRVDGYDEWIKIPAKRGYPSAHIMKVSGRYATFTPESIAKISIFDSSISGKTFVGKKVNIDTKITNTTNLDYEGVVRLSVRDDKDKEIALGKREYVWVKAGEKIEFNYVSPLLSVDEYGAPANIKAGSYTIGFVDAITGEWISDVMTMNYEELPETVISLDSFTFNGDPNNADPSNLEFGLKISCQKGYFTDGMDLTVWTWPQSGDMTYVTTISTGDLDIEAGKSVELKLKGKIEEPIIGMRYIVGAWYGGNQYGSSVSFTVTSSGIEDIELDSVKRTDVYNMSGVKVATVDGENVDRTQLQKGIYIFRFIKSSGKVETQRIMVK